MRLELTGRNVVITPALRQILNRRLSKIDRLLNDSAVSAQVVLTREKYRHLTDIAVHARGDHMLTGQGSATTWPLSMKQAAERIEQHHRIAAAGQRDGDARRDRGRREVRQRGTHCGVDRAHGVAGVRRSLSRR